MNQLPVMYSLFFALSVATLFTSCAARKPDNLVKKAEVERIIKTLSADEMEGRATFSTGIEKAAAFISSEFKKAGIQPLKGAADYYQKFKMTRIQPVSANAVIDGKTIVAENLIVITDRDSISWDSSAGVETVTISATESFFDRYRALTATDKQLLVLVDIQHRDAFKRLKEYNESGRIIDERNENGAAVFVLSIDEAKKFSIKFKNRVEKSALTNVAGMIPGKSKEKELVVFSGHYDHLGIIDAVSGDSIANGADDDASGVTAVIALANYYNKLDDNERTLIFVAFTAEESGGYGSKYFSKQLNPDNVMAMFNIEMIGKDSKFGDNSAFITGYERSDFGKILQKNLAGTAFKFYPDPYPDQNLFYRSDNATLAALGVPAHTVSTDQIDTDKFYHTVNDEFETLDVNNIVATIKAIALSSRSIVAGIDTPKRIPKME